jgi:hypothetical protein
VTHLTLHPAEYLHWRKKLKTWIPVCKGIDEPCWLCDEIGEYITFRSPDWSRTADWAYDICPTCAVKLGLVW